MADSDVSRAKDISSVSRFIEPKSKTEKSLGSVANSISKFTKDQKKILDQMQKKDKTLNMKEIGYSKGIKEVEQSMKKIMGKLGYVIGDMSKGAKKIMLDTARASKDAVVQYSKVINQELQINKQNVVGLALSRSTPIFGYFIAKFMETEVWQRMISKVKEKFSDAITFVSDRFKAGWEKTREKFKEWWLGDKKLEKLMAATKKILQFPFEKFGQVLRATLEATKFLVKLPFKAIGLAFSTVLKTVKFVATLPFKAVSLAFHGLIALVKSPFKLLGGIFRSIKTGFGLWGKKKEPHMAEGGFVKRTGSVTVHKGEIVAPIKKLKELVTDPLLKELRGLRFAMVGPNKDFSVAMSQTLRQNPMFRALDKFASIFKASIVAPLKFLFGMRGKYRSMLPKSADTFQNISGTLGLLFTNTMIRLDAIYSGITGKKFTGTDTPIGTRYSQIKKFIKDRKAGKPLGGGKDLIGMISHHLDLNEKEMRGFFEQVAPGLAEKGQAKAKELYGAGMAKVAPHIEKGKAKGKEITGSILDTLLHGKTKVMEKFRKTGDLKIHGMKEGGIVSEDSLAYLHKDEEVVPAKKRGLIKRKITGVTEEGLIDATKAIGKFGFAIAKLPFTALVKTISIAVRTGIKLASGISKLAKGVFDLTMWISRLPLRILFKTVSTLVKVASSIPKAFMSVTSGILGGISKFVAGGGIKGVAGRIKGRAKEAWSSFKKGPGEKSGTEKLGEIHGKEKKKTGVEGELQKIRHSLEDFHASVDKSWVESKTKKGPVTLTQSFRNMLSSMKESKEGIKKQYSTMKDSYKTTKDMLKNDVAAKKLLKETAENTGETAKHTKKNSSIFEHLMMFLMPIGTAIFSFIESIPGKAINMLKSGGKGIKDITGIMGGAEGGVGGGAVKEKGKRKGSSTAKLAAGGMAGYDAIEGYLKSADWGVSGTSGIIGSILGGTSSGLQGAIEGGIKGAAFIASFTMNPKAIIAGMISGAILGYIGGKKIASWVESITNIFTGANAAAEAEAAEKSGKTIDKEAADAKLTGFESGGLVDKTGPALVHAGEYVIPKEQVEAAKRSGRPPEDLLEGARKPTPSDMIDSLLGSIGEGIQSAVSSVKTGFSKIFSGAQSGFGWLSRLFESGGAGAGAISSGVGDPGGKSYGKYQFASKRGVVGDFLQSTGYDKKFGSLAGDVGGAQFDEKWRELAATDPGFSEAQDKYIKSKYLDPQMSKISSDIGSDLSSRADAVKEEVLSTAVQYGPASSVISKALQGKDMSKLTDEDLLKAIGEYKSANVASNFRSSSPAVQASVGNRIQKEIGMALGALQQGSEPAIAKVADSTIPSAQCGGVVKESGLAYVHAGEIIGPLKDISDSIGKAIIGKGDLATTQTNSALAPANSLAGTLKGFGDQATNLIGKGQEASKGILASINNMMTSTSNVNSSTTATAPDSGFDKDLNNIFSADLD